MINSAFGTGSYSFSGGSHHDSSKQTTTETRQMKIIPCRSAASKDGDVNVTSSVIFLYSLLNVPVKDLCKMMLARTDVPVREALTVPDKHTHIFSRTYISIASRPFCFSSSEKKELMKLFFASLTISSVVRQNSFCSAK